jgi:hypothetical protein
MCLMSTTLIPPDIHLAFHVHRKNDDSRHETVKNHCLNYHVAVKKVPIGVEVRVGANRHHLRYNRNILRFQVCTVKHNQNTGVDKHADEHTCSDMLY